MKFLQMTIQIIHMKSIVVISDGSNEVSQAVSITVTDVPEAPEFDRFACSIS